MKIYKDFSKTEEVKDVIDLGVVEVGLSKEFIFYVLNDSEWELVDLVFSLDNKEVKIVSAPKTLKSNEVDKLILNYTPDVTIEKKLYVGINIEGVKLI